MSETPVVTSTAKMVVEKLTAEKMKTFLAHVPDEAQITVTRRDGGYQGGASTTVEAEWTGPAQPPKQHPGTPIYGPGVR